MEVRYLAPQDDRMAVSHIYEASWKATYRGIVPQSYLDGIPAGQWAAGLDSGDMRHVLLVDRGALIGASGFCGSRSPQFGGFGEIVSLYLLPERVGTGCGRRLLTFVLKELAELGYTDAFLWVLEENRAARAFYQKAGFVQKGPAQVLTAGGAALRALSYCRRI